jgi:putative SOS response-associated peptidase YedK
MCGRFSQTYTWEDLLDHYTLVGTPQNLAPRYNIAPTQKAMVVRLTADGARTAAGLRWGLLPPFAKDTKMAGRFINARSETASSLGAFKHAFRERRCLVPVDGFYEWRREGKKRIPFRITPEGDGLFALAGLWQPWRVPDGLTLKGEYADYAPGDVIDTFTILTTTPSHQIAPLHDRMPVIVSSDHFDRWLAGPATREHQALLRPTPDPLAIYRVNQRINNVANDDPECIEPVDDESDD